MAFMPGYFRRRGAALSMEIISRVRNCWRQETDQVWFGRGKIIGIPAGPASRLCLLDAPDFAPAAKACWRRSWCGRSVRHVLPFGAASLKSEDDKADVVEFVRLD